MTPSEIFFLYVAPSLIVFFSLVLSFRTDLIMEGTGFKHYSLSRVQLLWWTVIILCCFSVKFGSTMKIPELNESILFLLGIGTGTITVAKLMSDSKKSKESPTTEEEEFDFTNQSNGLLYDILDDGSGVSIHRFQAVLFNLVFGFTFLNQFFADMQYVMPYFSNEQLSLLGISSSTYLLMKNSETKKKGKLITNTPQSTKSTIATVSNIETEAVEASINPRAIVDIDDQEDIEMEARG